MSFGLGLIGIGVSAAGSVGTAFIGADAAKYVAKKDAKAALGIALAQERGALAQAQAQAEIAAHERAKYRETTGTVVFGLLVFGLLVGAGSGGGA